MGWAWRVELDVLCCCRLSYGNWHKVHKTGTMGLYSNGSFCGDATCVSGSRDDAHGPWSLPKLWRRGKEIWAGLSALKISYSAHHHR